MENLKKLRGKKSQQQVANALNISQVAYSAYELGKRRPDPEMLSKLANYYGVTVDHLLGRESAFVTEPQYGKGIMIPVLGKVPAGMPIEAVEEVIGKEEISHEMARRGNHFALKVKGDSMFPEIKDGDIVIVRQQDTAESGNIVVAFVNGYDATIKKIKLEGKGITLVPLNHNYEVMYYNQQQIGELPVKIIGKVVEVRRSL